MSNICGAMTLQDVMNLLSEVERPDDSSAQRRAGGAPDPLEQLMSEPRAFLEQRGFFAPPNARIRVYRTEELVDRLRTDEAIDHFLDNAPRAAFDVHIKEGKGKCTHLSVE